MKQDKSVQPGSLYTHMFKMVYVYFKRFNQLLNLRKLLKETVAYSLAEV